MRILIADDSATARMVVRRCLEIAGCAGAEFTEAKNGVEALALTKRDMPDLVVTDLTMPEMDGARLLEMLQGDRDTKDIPVLVVTSASNPAKSEELQAKGAFAVLPKPVQPADMAEVLEPLLPEDEGGGAW